jgi:transcriptional regulator GlxA family with amidase domain
MGENTIKSLLRTENNAGPQKIGFLLLNQFSMIAFASAIEPLRAANRQSNQALFEWVVASPDGNASTASNGMIVQTAAELEALQS